MDAPRPPACGCNLSVWHSRSSRHPCLSFRTHTVCGIEATMSIFPCSSHTLDVLAEAGCDRAGSEVALSLVGSRSTYGCHWQEI